MPSLQNKGLQSLVFNLRLMKNYLVLGGLVLVLAFSSCWVHIWQTCYPGSNPSYYTQTMDIYRDAWVGIYNKFSILHFYLIIIKNK